jgi:hypothetical protein
MPLPIHWEARDPFARAVRFSIALLGCGLAFGSRARGQDLPAATALSSAAKPAANLPAWCPWKVADFQNAPEFEILQTDKSGVQSILFRGPGYKALPFTKVFAYYGKPALPAGQKAPALVLIHGWAGQAMRGWVQEANKHGFAALSLSTNGLMEGPGGQLPVPDDFRGPGDGYTGSKTKGPMPFADLPGEPPAGPLDVPRCRGRHARQFASA